MKDPLLVKELSIYAFSTLYEKLKWIERIEALDVATRSAHERLDEIIELVKVSMLKDNFQDFFEPTKDIIKGSHIRIMPHHIT